VTQNLKKQKDKIRNLSNWVWKHTC